MSLDDLKNLNIIKKQILLLFFDSFLTISVLVASFYIRLGYLFLPDDYLVFLVYLSPLISIPIYIKFGLYRSVMRYIGFQTVWKAVQAVSLYSLIWGILAFMSGLDGIPRSVIIINWFLSIIAIVGFRMIAKWLLSDFDKFKEKKPKRNIAIYGAGRSGIQLLDALKRSENFHPIAFIDDSSAIQGRLINGFQVYDRDSLPYLIKREGLAEIFIAIPSLKRKELRKIFDSIENYKIPIRSVPSLEDFAKGKIEISSLKKITIEDLLGRDAVLPDQTLIEVNIKNKVVLVTGAGGSIGSEICRQAINLGVKKLILYEMSELALYKIEQELISTHNTNIEVFPILGSVMNLIRLEKACKKFNVETIFHAAAYKHVPLVEYNLEEGVSNNVMGTLNTAIAARNCNVENFVLISTDKAVRPTNIMGASKRLAEMVVQSLAKLKSNTKFAIVRFGNVLGSSGSVIPLFKKQISKGGPITLTDKNVIRYFMTISEAVELVIQAGSMGNNGEIFILDMGKPVKIYDLAKKMITLSGLTIKNIHNPDGDIEIKLVGLRPGEKLFEELLTSGKPKKTSHPLIMKTDEKVVEWNTLRLILEELEQLIEANETEEVVKKLTVIVDGYNPESNIVDLLK